ncbi:MAG: hypothetical protein HDR08_03275 [Lachnospiraceae bacterium]|nr:hypothetical protein [Lachnospiraceae bacterium]
MRSDRGNSRLNEAFQYLNDKFLDIAEQEKRTRKRKPVRFYWGVIAACICLVLLIPAGAMAGKWLGVRELLLPEGKSKMTLISLSGYQESPEAKALAEWKAFLENYDTDHKILDAIGNDIFVVEGREDWFLYYVYSYEMGEKLDEIAEKYDLKLHTQLDVVSQKELEYRVGCSLAGSYGGYIYEDGSFAYDGETELKEGQITYFQLRRVVKGTFDEVVLNIGQAENYGEWQYVTAGGEQVLLALGTDKALIFRDFEKCFITVNVLSGRDGGMTEEQLQKLADKIDFGALQEVKEPDMRGDR